MEQPRRLSGTGWPSSSWPPLGREPAGAGVSARNTQSYLPLGMRRSLRLMRLPILRQYLEITSRVEIFRKSASRAISSSDIQTNPGPPVQQFPHWVQVNESPSAYQG